MSSVSSPDEPPLIPSNIDCLIGAELFPFLIGERKIMPNNQTLVFNSVLGDIIMGRMPTMSHSTPYTFHVPQVIPNVSPLEDIVQKFYSVEEVPFSPQGLTLDEEESEKYFISTTQRLPSGRYAVSLPFKESSKKLGNSYEIAKKRPLNIEKKFKLQPDLKENHSKAINDYIDQGHASLVHNCDPQEEGYFMPHHAVVKLDKATTKVKIVFDDSCATSTGISLNDVLDTGPILYKNLVDLLINIRIFPITFTGDIKKIFWHGPPWLNSPIESLNLRQVTEDVLDEQMLNDKLLEEKPQKVLMNVQPQEHKKSVLVQIACRISKWNIVLRTVALVVKFCRLLPPRLIFCQDLKVAEAKLIQSLQREVFVNDLKIIENNKQVSFELLKLRPFAKDNLPLCGGLIENASQIDYQHAHPIILPKKHHIFNFLIDKKPQRNLHTSPQLLFSILRKKYWILGGRDIVRQRVMKCILCFKHCPKSSTSIMAALRRFLARRGVVKVLYSDNGSNFIGASNILHEMYSFLYSKPYKDSFEKELLDQRIEFRFNPTASPYFGGLWEISVRQVKSHLSKVIGPQILSYEEMNTLLIEIEAILNSRPLCEQDADPSAPKPLTAAHFLMQEPVQHMPLIATPLNLGQRYKLIEQMVHSIWKRFSEEYLSQLQQRSKWLKDNTTLKPGSLVLIKTENAPVLSWPLGRVIGVYPGKDGIVRVALVRTKSGELKRPVVKLCPLPNQIL